MVKRRRERDRPKAAHDAPYNPNKRVLLSYASDDEVEDEVKAESQIAAVANTNAQVPHAVVAAQEPLAEPASDEAFHRELFEEAWPEHDLEEEVEAEEADKTNATGQTGHGDSLWTRGIRRNETTGQWAALGSLAYQWEDEDGEEVEGYDTEEDEAMSYLRAVRSERQGMPTVFKAANTYSQEELYDTGEGDTRGYYEDGAYVGRASLGPQLPPTEKVSIDPQEAFTRVLVQRFTKERERMHLPPNPDALAALDPNHPISFPAKSNKAYAEWHRLVRTTSPLPAQVRAMQGVEIFRLLELIQKSYLTRNANIVTNVSTWLWSLLAKLDDVGTMDNDQVWILRELGRKAILMQVSLSNPEAAEELERAAAEERMGREDSTQFPSLHSEEGSDRMAKLKKGLDSNQFPSLDSEQSADRIAKLDPGLASVAHDAGPEKAEELRKVRQNTLATLDMIVALVGEVFGQRDLLQFRKSWTDHQELVSE